MRQVLAGMRNTFPGWMSEAAVLVRERNRLHVGVPASIFDQTNHTKRPQFQHHTLSSTIAGVAGQIHAHGGSVSIDTRPKPPPHRQNGGKTAMEISRRERCPAYSIFAHLFMMIKGS